MNKGLSLPIIGSGVECEAEKRGMPDFADVISRFWENLISRPSGPMAFRFVMQPTVAAIFAIRDGIKDVRTGHPPYLWRLLNDRARRGALLREGLAVTSKILIVALALDAIYQIVELGAFFPLEAVVIAFVLGFLPYLIVRGPTGRAGRWWVGRASARKTGQAEG
jgi:hypothetical protein